MALVVADAMEGISFADELHALNHACAEVAVVTVVVIVVAQIVEACCSSSLYVGTQM